jgi:putative glutamine amidotransferase
LKLIATWIRECDTPNFERVFGHYPQVRLGNARIESVSLDEAEGLLLTGGSDISEKFLRQPVPDPRFIEDADVERDAWEFAALANAMERRLPLLAICRGLQVLNVALGGTLHLDIPNHDSAKNVNVQELRYAEGVPLQFPRVNSSHHQALDRLGTGLVAEAWCVEDGVIEQARLVGYPFGLAVQFHPERDPLYQPLFTAFVDRVEQENR